MDDFIETTRGTVFKTIFYQLHCIGNFKLWYNFYELNLKTPNNKFIKPIEPKHYRKIMEAWQIFCDKMFWNY